MDNTQTLILGLGPVRSGTTYLYNLLKSNDFITTPKYYKESNYWIKDSDQINIDEFIDIFDNRNNKKFIADISPLYFGLEGIIETKKYFKNIKVFINLRDPVSKLRSWIRHNRAMGCELEPDDIINDKYSKSTLLMSDFLGFIKSNFDDSEIFFIDFDEIKTNPNKLIIEIAEFLDLPENSFNNANLEERVYRGRDPKNIKIARIASYLQKHLRYSLKLGTLANYLRDNSIIHSLIFTDEKSAIDVSAYLSFKEFYKDLLNDIEKTENLLDSDLNSWKKNIQISISSLKNT